MKVGVLGLGSIGMRHAKNLIAMGNEVIGYDPKVSVSLSVDTIQFVSEREELFKTVEAVVSATPIDQHIHDLQSAVEHGVPILIEKPIAGAESHELMDLLREAEHDELPIMVGYNLRFHDAAIKAKGLIDKGAIGQLYWGQFTCAQRNERYSDSVLLNWSHEIDLALWLMGPAALESAMLRRRGRVDTADLCLFHENGAGSTIHLDYVTAPFQRGGRIAGSKGVLSFNLESPRFVLHITAAGDHEVFYTSDTWDQNYVTEMEAFLRRAQGKPSFGATARDGVAALRICMEALK